MQLATRTTTSRKACDLKIYYKTQVCSLRSTVYKQTQNESNTLGTGQG